MTVPLVVVLLALVVGGCSSPSGGPPEPLVTGAFGSCEGLGSGTTAASGGALPGVELPCFDGRSVVHVDQIKGPAVINVWASWCEPCRKELPAFVRLAAQPGAPKVIGVVNADTRSAAASLAADLSVTFPTLFDETGRLSSNLGLGALPATIFVDEQGRMTHVYRSVALTDEALGALVERHL